MKLNPIIYWFVASLVLWGLIGWVFGSLIILITNQALDAQQEGIIMQINYVRINSILGIDELEFEAGKFNEISGPNGQGKTSVLEAIKAAVGGGHDASLLRKGAEKGEIVLVLDNGTEISKRVTERSSPLTIRTSDGGKATRPTDVLKSITDMLSINPVDFLRAPKKDRVRVLLETMPLEADTDKLASISGIPVKAQPGIHALAVIEAVRKQVYDDRTGTNRAVKEKDATINQLRLAMPDAPAGVTGSEDELTAQLDAARTAKDAELERVSKKLEGIRSAHGQKVSQIKADAQARIDAIRAEMQAAIDAEQAALNDIEGKAAAQRERTIAKFNDTASPLNQAIAAIRANRGAAAKREQALETVKQMERELAELKQDADRQTKALDEIDAYKVTLLAALPIPGLEVVDGELFRDGVPFDRLNTAQQVDIAVEIAKLRAGELAIACVDGLELLSSKTYEAFRERAIASDLQLFITRVSDGDFSIKTDTQ